MPLQPALLGGLFIGVLSALPVVNIGNCCCLWVVGGGMLAAYLDPPPHPANNLGRGAIDGLLAGIVGAFVFLVASSLVNTLMAPIQQRAIESLLSGGYEIPPEARVWLEMVRDREVGWLGSAIGFVFQLFIGVVFGTLGGVLGAMFFWRQDVPPALGGPPPPLPPRY